MMIRDSGLLFWATLFFMLRVKMLRFIHISPF